MRHAGRGIRHGSYRSVSADRGKALPIRRREGINILCGVCFSRFGLEVEDEVVPQFGWRKNNRCGPDPKTALDGKPGAAWDGGEGLGNGAAQLKTAAGAERRAAACDYAPSDGEPRAALGESRARYRSK